MNTWGFPHPTLTLYRPHHHTMAEDTDVLLHLLFAKCSPPGSNVFFFCANWSSLLNSLHHPLYVDFQLQIKLCANLPMNVFCAAIFYRQKGINSLIASGWWFIWLKGYLVFVFCFVLFFVKYKIEKGRFQSHCALLNCFVLWLYCCLVNAEICFLKCHKKICKKTKIEILKPSRCWKQDFLISSFSTSSQLHPPPPQPTGK